MKPRKAWIDLGVNAVHLKYVLRKINTNRDNFLQDGSSFPVVHENRHFGT